MVNSESEIIKVCLIDVDWNNAKSVRTYLQDLDGRDGIFKFTACKLAAAGSNANVWKAVNLAMYLNQDQIPSGLILEDVPVAPGRVAGSSARFFNEKFETSINKGTIDHIGVFKDYFLRLMLW